MLSGPAGSGKTTLAARAVEKHPDICRAITATTREPRPGEQDGREYYFLSKAAFRERIDAGAFVEHAEFNGNLYGTPRAELDRRLATGQVVLLVIDVQGARQVREQLPQAIFIFVLPPSLDALRERLVQRGTEDSSDMENRLAIAEQEVACMENYDYLVINDDETAATTDLLELLTFARAHRIRGGEREAWLDGAYEGWHDVGGKG